MAHPVHEIVVSAPGKIILMGEHAAVYGHPAVVAAIDLRLRVTATQRSDGIVTLDLPTMEHRGESQWGDLMAYTLAARQAWERCFGEGGDPASYRPVEGEPDRLVRLALGETVQATDAPRLGVNIHVESKLPLGSGFGSSAALAAGVAGAYLRFASTDVEPHVLQQISLEVERRQHGMPSGVDHNAVLQGGVLWAHRDESGELILEPLETKNPLLSCFRVFHSGMPAESTGMLVDAVRRRLKHARRRFREIFEVIDETTRELKVILTADEDAATRIIALIRTCEAALEELGVVPEPIRRIIRKIEAAGGAAKISGAGALTGDAGGSILVYHPDPDSIARWDFLGPWLPLPVRLGSEGLRSEGTV